MKRELKFVFISLILIVSVSCEKKQVPSVETLTASGITNNSAVIGANIKSDGNALITKAGVCWSKKGDPSIDDNSINAYIIDGGYKSTLTGLDPGTAYSAKAYAINSAGVGYGNTVYFNTLPDDPIITTSEISSITTTTASGGGHITFGDGITIVFIGLSYSKTHNPTIENSTAACTLTSGSFSGKLSGLAGGTVYYVRAVAVFKITSLDGYFVIYGNEVSFTTDSVIPVEMITYPKITTGDVSSVGTTNATLSAIVESNGGAQLLSRGICLDTINNPNINSTVYPSAGDEGPFSVNIENLTPATYYYYRAFAINSAGIQYGETKKFATYYGYVDDISGNTYTVIRIGNQFWMKEFLRTTKLSNNIDIQLITDKNEWATISSPAYCYYNNTQDADYGPLYNWYAVNTGKLCPEGWHVPEKHDWDVLQIYLKIHVGGKLKEAGFQHWQGESEGDNSSFFTALPGGLREFCYCNENPYSDFHKKGYEGCWWSATPYWSASDLYKGSFDTTQSVYAISFQLYSTSNDYVDKMGGNVTNGLSVRCLKNP